MDTIFSVTPISKPVHLELEVPGSKSITNRALLLASLANGTSTICGTLFSDDSRHFLNCLKELGFPVIIREAQREVVVTGFGGEIPKKEAHIYVGSAGTAARFLTAMLGLSNGTYYLDASEQMKKRPMKPLLTALEEMGAVVIYQEKEGYFPFMIKGASFKKLPSSVKIDVKNSSQFLSALLMVAPMIKQEITIELTGQTHALSYVEITTTMIKQFGGELSFSAPNQYHIPENISYQPQIYQVEPDISAACYFYAMIPLLGGSVLVKGVHLDSMQGDIEFINLLEKMGCSLRDTSLGICLEASPNFSYSGVTVDMGAYSDQTMTLAALALFATSPTSINNIAHIRLQECDRIKAIETEFNRMGITCTSTDSSITIMPGLPKPTEIETYDDHRIAMAFSLIGLRAFGIVIKNPSCCRKTFENYFDMLSSIIEKNS